jgi:hypothetical protein
LLTGTTAHDVSKSKPYRVSYRLLLDGEWTEKLRILFASPLLLLRFISLVVVVVISEACLAVLFSG